MGWRIRIGGGPLIRMASRVRERIAVKMEFCGEKVLICPWVTGMLSELSMTLMQLWK